jgi:hypothetical protein
LIGKKGRYFDPDIYLQLGGLGNYTEFNLENSWRTNSWKAKEQMGGYSLISKL